MIGKEPRGSVEASFANLQWVGDLEERQETGEGEISPVRSIISGVQNTPNGCFILDEMSSSECTNKRRV